jgi:hypothetical protein
MRLLNTAMGYVSACCRGIVARLKADALLYGLVAIYTALGLTLLWMTGRMEMAAHALYFAQWPKVFLVIMPLLAVLADAVFVIHRFDKRRRLAFRRMFSARRMASLFAGMALMIGLMFFQGTFTSMKNALPAFWGGFPFDRQQADIDAWLHFGAEPWAVLHRIAPPEWVLTAVEFNYNVLWFVFCFGMLFFVATSPGADGIRRRYMLLFGFSWVVCGNLLAGLFLSAGPVYYGQVAGDMQRFSGLVAALEPSRWASSASVYQAYLWSLYEQKTAGFGGGISAFPSMHVGLVALNALFIREYSRRLGMVAFAYLAVVQLSSVYLGWHYAIDGYVSIAVVAAGYGIASRAMRRPLATDDIRDRKLTAGFPS